jgi:hypothetical protein
VRYTIGVSLTCLFYCYKLDSNLGLCAKFWLFQLSKMEYNFSNWHSCTSLFSGPIQALC